MHFYYLNNNDYSKQNILRYYETIYTEYLEGYQKQCAAEYLFTHANTATKCWCLVKFLIMVNTYVLHLDAQKISLRPSVYFCFLVCNMLSSNSVFIHL